MAKLEGTHHVVTAAYTDSGAPVYLTQAGTWSRSLAEAQLIELSDVAESQVKWALTQEAVVADPYSFMITLETDGRINPQSKRESIRAEGPTTPIRRAD